MKFTMSMAKGNFFDRARVIQAMDRAARRNLSKFGAFVRTRARTSLRYRNKPSSAGSPPHVHKTLTRTKTSKKGKVSKQSVSPLRDFLFFAYDGSRKSVVIGPVKLNDRQGSVPEVLEHGGSSVIRDSLGRQRSVVIAARPFMRPALDATRKELPSIWRDSIQR